METHRVLRPSGSSPIVLLCDHASNWVPDDLHHLGLSPTELTRHIAWDIGSAGVTEILSEMLNASAVLCGTSRLVIDCNRQLDAPDLIPEVSDGTIIPGNRGLSQTAKANRVELYFKPYHQAIETLLTERGNQGMNPIVVSIHSMTASLAGAYRPWQIALSSFRDRSLADPLLAALRQPGDIVVGDNEPYDLDPKVDYSVPEHALNHGLRHLQVEFRNDLIVDRTTQQQWAFRFCSALRIVLTCA